MNNSIIRTVIENTFHNGFSLKNNKGKISRYGCCEFDEDPRFEVKEIADNQYALFKNGIKIKDIPSDTKATYGYWNDEHGEWKSLAERL